MDSTSVCRNTFPCPIIAFLASFHHVELNKNSTKNVEHGIVFPTVTSSLYNKLDINLNSQLASNTQSSQRSNFTSKIEQ